MAVVVVAVLVGVAVRVEWGMIGVLQWGPVPRVAIGHFTRRQLPRDAVGTVLGQF